MCGWRLLPESLAPCTAAVQPRHDLIDRLALRLGQVVEQEHCEQQRRHHKRHKRVVTECVCYQREGEPDHLGGNSFQFNFWLEFWLEKLLEIPFWFCDMSKLPNLELFIGVGNLGPKLKTDNKFILNCLPGSPASWRGWRRRWRPTGAPAGTAPEWSSRVWRRAPRRSTRRTAASPWSAAAG